MIRRKETLGYLDFMRGKYSVGNKEYIMNMLKQMTDAEKERLLTHDFDTLWCDIWGKSKMTNRYKVEELTSRDKMIQLISGSYLPYNLSELIAESNQYGHWNEPEWGFPKGRRSSGESDYDCAVREFCEETGYKKTTLQPVQNVVPPEEIFVGSNYVCYKHKYFLMHMEYRETVATDTFQRSEVSQMAWYSMDECMTKIRHYNLEKRRVIANVDKCLRTLTLYTA